MQVKHWITFNEPWVICWMGYGSAEYAPGIKDPAVTPYRCGHNIIRSHAKAFDTYNMRYRSLQKGKSQGKIYGTSGINLPGAFGLSSGLCGIRFLRTFALLLIGVFELLYVFMYPVYIYWTGDVNPLGAYGLSSGLCELGVV